VAGAAGVDPQQATFSAEEKLHILDRLTPPKAWSATCTPSTSARSASRSKAARAHRQHGRTGAARGAKGVQEIVIGMAHRGRLNVLVNTLGKMPKDLFAEFDHTARSAARRRREVPPGFLERRHDARRPVHLSLAFNPSHLEIVNR